MTTPQHSTAASAEEATQGRETHAREPRGPECGVKAGVWTERMLSALANGVKGGKWFSLMDKVFAPATLALERWPSAVPGLLAARACSPARLQIIACSRWR